VDEFALSRMKHFGAKSAFLGYRKYPCQICISVNDQVVHGLAGSRTLCFGDIVSLDVGVLYNGFIGDTARTVAVGGCGVLAQKLMDIAEEALYQGIAQALAGGRVADISRAIQNHVEGNGFSVVREFVGHGVGRSMHEEPQVPNFVDGKSSPKLRPGMTLAIEPMVNAGLPGVKILNDGWTVVTQDGSLSAHFEHTVLITESEPEILTWSEKVPSKLKVP
jgi:methionyl aminopeptidase